MGYHLSAIDNDKLDIYIGSNTMSNLADLGAFDSPVSTESEKALNENDNYMAIVDESGVDHFLSVLKANPTAGRDVGKLVEGVESKYMKGFKITY